MKIEASISNFQAKSNTNMSVHVCMFYCDLFINSLYYIFVGVSFFFFIYTHQKFCKLTNLFKKKKKQKQIRFLPYQYHNLESPLDLQQGGNIFFNLCVARKM